MSRKKTTPTKLENQSMTGDHVGGLRDIAEILSTAYFLSLSRGEIPVVEEMMDMDVLTGDLTDMDSSAVTALLQSDFGKGFLMGMLHQSYTYQKLAEEHELEQGD